MAVAFSAAAIGAFLRWREHRRSGNGWAALALATLAVATIHSVVRGDDAAGVEQKALVLVVLLFPYLLFRFASSFVPARPETDIVAKIWTGGLIVVSLLPF